MEYEAFLKKLSNPARRALVSAGVNRFEMLAALSEKELLSFHGMGPKSLPIVKACLNSVGMTLRE